MLTGNHTVTDLVDQATEDVATGDGRLELHTTKNSFSKLSKLFVVFIK